jgi:large subunit ribosomal protein L3
MTVTVVEAGPCTILRRRTRERDGYEAVQLGFEPIIETKVKKPVLGQFKKAGAGCFRHVREFRIAEVQSNGGWTVGQHVTVELFKPYELVDVTGTSIGKGFQGGVKRWGWSGGPATHGSTSHRAPGSIGSSTDPGRVLRGHHLPGHMGNARVTVQNLRIIRVQPDANLLLIEGAIPGAAQSLVMVKKSQKRFEVVKPPRAIVEVVEEEPTTKTKRKK